MVEGRLPPEDRPLNFNNSDFTDFLRNEAIRVEEKRDKNADSSTQAELHLCNQLMLLSTVLLTGSVVWFGSKDVTRSLTQFQTIALIMMLIFLITSVSAGIKYYFILSNFFGRWALSEEKVSDVYRNREFTTWNEAIKKIKVTRKGLDNSANRFWLFCQITLLSLAVVSLMLLISGVLFDFTFITK